MKTKLFILTTLLIAVAAYGGSVSGTVSYSGTESGLILIACIEEGDTVFDLATLTAITMIMAPGAYSIDDSTLIDGVNFYAVAFMGLGSPPIPASGSPAGIHPAPVVLTGGVATGADITLEPVADVGGTVHYSGDMSEIYINVWDVYAEFTDSISVLESTHFIGDTIYLLADLPSGPKRIQAFADANGNGILDASESFAYAEGPYGTMIIVGGGGVSDSGVDIDLPVVGIDDFRATRPSDFTIEIAPNPFNSACKITAPGAIEILDIEGRLVRTLEHSGIWDGTDDSGKSLPSGTYLARASFSGITKTARIYFVK